MGTPGRILELMRMKGGMSSTRVTYANNNNNRATSRRADSSGSRGVTRGRYAILDEADRMFSLGFESQIRSILGQFRPDRQVNSPRSDPRPIPARSAGKFAEIRVWLS